MKIGIRKIQYIHRSKVSDFSQFPRGSRINLSEFISDSLSDLPFTPEIAEYSESWVDDDNGKCSEVELTAIIRADKEEHRNTLQALLGSQHIFILTLISGIKYIIGTSQEIPTFIWTDKISGISNSEFAIKITNKSLHGVLQAI